MVFCSRSTMCTALFATVLIGAGIAQRLNGAQVPRVFPRLQLENGWQLDYVRVFASDQDVRKRPFNPVKDALAGSGEDDVVKARDLSAESQGEISDAQRQQIVVDSVHTVQPLQPRSVLGEVADTIASLGSDHGLSMAEPAGVTTDSQQRVIVTDPAIHAIHVFDFRQKRYFRIQGGQGRRLQSPVGVAVDVTDNIYVTDSKLGMILVYGPDGRFLRYIGKAQEGGAYDTPSGIAIDRKSGHIYVLDTPRHLLFVLDRYGKVLSRIGERGGDAAKGGAFKNPTDVLIKGDELAIADDNRCRVQFVDLQGKFLRQFRTSYKDCDHRPGPGGLAMDSDGNTYLANGPIYVYDRSGRFQSALGPAGGRRGEFNVPRGLWLDTAGHLYVADSQNHRVQEFQLHRGKAR